MSTSTPETNTGNKYRHARFAQFIAPRIIEFGGPDALAAELGVKHTITILHWMNGRYVPYIPRLLAAAEVLGVCPHAMLDAAGKPPIIEVRHAVAYDVERTLPGMINSLKTKLGSENRVQSSVAVDDQRPRVPSPGPALSPRPGLVRHVGSMGAQHKPACTVAAMSLPAANPPLPEFRDDYVLAQVDVDYMAPAVKSKHFIHIDQSECIQCEACVDICPWKCLFMLSPSVVAEAHGVDQPGADPSDNSVFVIDDDVCTRCALCVDRCPTGVVVLGTVGEPGPEGERHLRSNANGSAYGLRLV